MSKEKVQYQLLKPAFVNGIYVDPTDPHAPGVEHKDGKAFVMADPGLDGAALRSGKAKPTDNKPTDNKPTDNKPPS